MKKIVDFLISMKTMIVLTLIFAAACAIATFIENDHGTETAWAVVYGTRWFEVIMVLLAINLTGNIFRYKLFKKEKLPSLLFHAGFLVILIGAAITRYIGYEGIMHIREGQTQDKISSSSGYLQMDTTKDGKHYHAESKILISKISSNDFTLSLDVDGKAATLNYKNYLPSALEKVVSDPNGKPMINMMFLKEGAKPEAVTLSDGEVYGTMGVNITLNHTTDNGENDYIHIYNKGENFYFKSNKPMTWFVMADKSSGNYEADKEYEFIPGRLYALGDIKLVPREIYAKAAVKLVNEEDSVGGRKMKADTKQALIATLTYNGESKDVTMMGYGKGALGIPTHVTVGGENFTLQWGSKLITLPFSIKLLDFQLERYPGSMSPSSYASEVVLIDKEQNIEKPFRIYMNHILDHRNYRFFQSSYDRDEKGTVLSVNNDPGKIPTYIGYLMMAIGFIWTLFNPKSRFKKLARAVQKDTQVGVVALLIGLLFLFQPHTLEAKTALETAKSYQNAHAEKFGDILIQTFDGRIKPMDTFANEVLLKLHKKSSVKGLSASQVMLGMLTAPDAWQEIPLIKVSHTKIRKILGLKEGEKYASFNDFFANQQSYKLMQYSNEAMQKRPIMRNEFDRSVIKTDEKLNIAYMIFTGELLKIVPKIDDPMQKWYSVKESINTFPPQEANEIRTLFINYFGSIDKARETGDWSDADKNVAALLAYQHKTSAAIIPSDRKLKAEKFFKRYSITNKLIIVYILTGLILLALIMIKMVKPTLNTTKITKFVQSFFILAFLIHTLVLAARWYIGGHAPWSNAYEAMLYVAWSMALAGMIFMKYSPMVPSLTSIIAGSTLAATFFNEMNPQITNLVPVLKSYWLNIHVSMITASYGFLGLSMILGLFTLVLFILRNSKNRDIEHSITEATRINEMTAIVGLMMLTIGNFLGGVWANESWGRYWGWDPKETWAWISILVYVVVLHIRFIPWFNKNYEFNFAVASTVAYSSIVMTFVGVNYYLSGMHSYAAGDPVPIPGYLYVTIAALLALIVAASFKRDKKRH
jgi:cytochrome c-type biogenesis protein CcsB